MSDAPSPPTAETPPAPTPEPIPMLQRYQDRLTALRKEQEQFIADMNVQRGIYAGRIAELEMTIKDLTPEPSKE